MTSIRHIAASALLAAAPLAVWPAQRWVGSGERVLAWPGGAPADRVRLGVRDEGMYRVGVGEIAAAAGVATNSVLAALAGGTLALRTQGYEVAWTTNAACDALLFYGTAAADIYAPENVYWLSFGSGPRMERLDAAPEGGSATNAWFMHAEAYRAEFLLANDPLHRRSSRGSLTNVLNFGRSVWGSTDENKRRVDRILNMPGYDISAATGVAVRAHLCSYRDFVFPDTHECEIMVNGVGCGSRAWSGEQAAVYEYAVPDGALTNSAPMLTVRNARDLTVNDFMILDVELVYPRSYRAACGRLLCAGGAGEAVSVDGFLSGTLRVWDVTDQEEPLDLAAAVWTDEGGEWCATFVSGDAATRYAVFDEAAGCYDPSVAGVRDIDWHDPAEMPEMAIVIPPRRWVAGFDEAVQPLADFRNAQGLATRVIDAEEIYNAFTGGLVHPEAFRRFAAEGVTNGPARRLRYMLFAGYGGSDYKLEVFGFNGQYPALLPLYLLPHVFSGGIDLRPAALLLPNDPVLGDAAGDAVPEVAVWRFIATSAAELSDMVGKTIWYEITEAWKSTALFFADVPEVGTVYDFTAIASDTSLNFEDGGWTADRIFAGQGDAFRLDLFWKNSIAQTGAYYKLLGGVGFFYFIGHSSDTLAGGKDGQKHFLSNKILTAADWPFAPAALLLGCRLGRWNRCIADAYTVNEAGARNRTSGFAAVISPAGYMQPADARDYSQAFGAVCGCARRAVRAEQGGCHCRSKSRRVMPTGFSPAQTWRRAFGRLCRGAPGRERPGRKM